MRVAFICSGMHPAHKPFVEAINADVFPVYEAGNTSFKKFINAFRMAKKYPKYDVYLLEGGMPMFPMYLRKKIFSENGLVIGLLADETFVNLVNRLPHYSLFETCIHKLSVRVLNAAISVSPMIKQFAKKVLSIPIEVVRPPIPVDSFIRLKRVKPNLDSKIIVSVGQPRFSIGMDILVDNFRIAKKVINDLELWIVGKGHPKDYEKINGVKVLGYVDDLSEVFRDASLFVHAGRCSAYPIATLEAMRGGLPVVVTHMTGTKELVSEVECIVKDKFNLEYPGFKFISKFDNLWSSILFYFNLDIKIRKYLSKLYKAKSSEFDPEVRCKEFKRKFEYLLNRCGMYV